MAEKRSILPSTYNIVDYVLNERETFDERPLCRVDSLVFSCVAYFHLPLEPSEACGLKPATQACTWEGMALKDLYRSEWKDTMIAGIFDGQGMWNLLSVLAASPRFRDIRAFHYVTRFSEQEEEQFSALSFAISPRDTLVTYRGTDNSLVGWKEDFNMAFSAKVPSQARAVRYLEDVAAHTRGNLWCAGHSKGGNLAVYAGLACDKSVTSRVKTCFSLDGPGFSEEALKADFWEHAQDKVDKTIPQSSIVGMLFERQEMDYTVVKSTNSGLMQHAPLSWEVEGRDFYQCEHIGRSAGYLDESLSKWIAGLSLERREAFVDTLFSIFAASGEQTFGAISSNWMSALPKMMDALGKLAPEDKDMFVGTLQELAAVLVGVGQVRDAGTKEMDAGAATGQKTAQKNRDTDATKKQSPANLLEQAKRFYAANTKPEKQ